MPGSTGQVDLAGRELWIGDGINETTHDDHLQWEQPGFTVHG